jgi:hypothetical protein
MAKKKDTAKKKAPRTRKSIAEKEVLPPALVRAALKEPEFPHDETPWEMEDDPKEQVISQDEPEEDRAPYLREDEPPAPLPPALLNMQALAKETCYELEPFQAVQEDSSDKETTISDLAILNNHLALCTAALPHVHSIQTLCSLSSTVTKLIEVRRGVKKLEYGSPKTAIKGRVFEVIE